MSLFESLYQQGNTVIVVTHESDVARHARRAVHLRDGVVESDEPTPVAAIRNPYVPASPWSTSRASSGSNTWKLSAAVATMASTVSESRTVGSSRT